MRILTALFICFSSPALALSCLAPDLARDFQSAQASEDTWIVAEGKLTFRDIPNVENTAQKPRTIRAYMSGHSLGLDGFVNKFSTPVTLEVECAGPWCGGVESGLNYMAFLKKQQSGYTAYALPCGGMLYADPSAEDKARVLSCMRGEGCEEKQRF